MVAAIYEDARECDRRLKMFFWSERDHWIEIVKAAVAGRAGCGGDHPKAAPGFLAWSSGIARMRQIFRREGWASEDVDGIETIVNHDLKVRVTLMNADEGTCDRTRSPRNRTIKGGASERLTDLNDQFELFREGAVGEKPEGYPLWYLCVYDDGTDVRAELSRPVSFRGGYFQKFSERIFIIIGGDWSKITLEGASERAKDLEVPVHRRA